jgi:hypothetical protein
MYTRKQVFLCDGFLQDGRNFALSQQSIIVA